MYMNGSCNVNIMFFMLKLEFSQLKLFCNKENKADES